MDEEQKREIQQMIDVKIRSHEHLGGEAQQIQIESIFGLIRTVDDATDLANALAETPRSLYEQLLIDTSTGTKKLYIFDTVGDTWYSVTIT